MQSVFCYIRRMLWMVMIERKPSLEELPYLAFVPTKATKQMCRLV